MLNAGEFITSSQTVFIYTGTPGCFDESTFNVNITGGPIVDDLANQTALDFYTFPTITGTNLTGNQAYYTGPSGTGTIFLEGDMIAFDPAETYPITLYIYDITGSCDSQEDFELTITDGCNAPTADMLSDANECTEYELPTLSPGNNYYTETNAGGTLLNAGEFITSSQTIFIYTGTPGCFDESTFNVTITGGPIVDDLPNQTAIDIYTFPTITGTNLTGNQAYYAGPSGTGTIFLEGDMIAFDPAETYPITLYIYDITGSCDSQEDFELTITDGCNAPTADFLSDVTECTEYELPALSPGNNYYTETNAGGTLLNAGEFITSSQTVYIYTGTPGCFDESSFNITIEPLLCESDINLPNFFTPNGDSYNEIWDFSSITDNNALVYIFNRYGKLLTQLNRASTIGWDGNYQGKKLPSSDYWYKIILSDGKIIQGHFALKR